MLKHKIVKDTLIYSVSNYIAMAIGMMVSFAIKAILGTVGAGYWAILKVVTSYGEYTDLGTRNILSRDLPQAVGEGDQRKITLVQNNTFSFSLSMSILAGIFIAVLALIYIDDPMLKNGLLVTSVLVILTQGYNYFIVILRAKKRFTELGYLIIQNMLLVALFPIVGGYYWGLIGLAIGFCLATGFSIILAYKAAKTNIQWKFDRVEILRLLKAGLPMVVLSYVLVTFLSMDAIMVGKMIGMEALGLYTIGLMAVQQISRLGRFASIVIFPHIQERYGSTKSLSDSKHFFIKSTMALTHMLPIVIAATAYLIEPAVHVLIPGFAGGLPSMRILVLGYFFIAINEMSQNILFTVNQQAKLVPIYLALLALGFGLNYIFIKLNQGIEGVAIATSITYIAFFLSVFSYAFKSLLSWKELFVMIIKISLIFIYFVISFVIVGAFTMNGHVWVEAFIRMGLILLLLIPIWLPFEREEHLMRITFQVIKTKLGVS